MNREGLLRAVAGSQRIRMIGGYKESPDRPAPFAAKPADADAAWAMP
jgi:hypothetical protein